MKEKHPEKLIEAILAGAKEGHPLTDKDCLTLLALTEEEQVTSLFEAAREVRDIHFGNRIFLYGFVYTSTFCRNNCRFCFYRQSNPESVRYRKTPDEIVVASSRLADSGVHLIDLTMGEDPRSFVVNDGGFEELISMVGRVKSATGLPVMVSPGVVPDDVLADLASAGADWYACYQETHNRELFKNLRVGQSYGKRLEKKRLAHKLGMLIEEGMLCGIGESNRDVVESIAAVRSLDADQTRVMNFVPQKGTPMEDHLPADPARERVITAVMRLAFPDRLIPASLDVGGLDGLRPWLDAGANVVTSLVPPGQGLAGVAQNSLDIEDARRTAGSVGPVLSSCGLQVASLEDFLAWMESRKGAIRQGKDQKVAAC